MRTLVVVGGGVSGMAAARLLAGARRLGSGGDPAPFSLPGARVVLLEASSRLGGKVLTGNVDGVPVELGPDQFLRRDPVAELWCESLGLDSSLVAPAARVAGVWSYGALRPLPAGLVLGVPTDLGAVRSSGVVSAEGCARAALDAALPGEPLGPAELGLWPAEEADGRSPKGTGERSAGAILRARLGDEIVDRLVDPLLGGINAGGVDRLSLSTVAPAVARALVGTRQVMEPLRPLAPPLYAIRGEGASRTPSPFFGLAGGLGRLVDAAAAELDALGVEVRLSSPASKVVLSTDGGSPAVVVLASGEHIEADGAVLALPPSQAAGLLESSLPAAAGRLASIPSASVTVTTFAFEAGDVDVPPGWTGFLVPRVEGLLTTAVTFLSQKWPWTLDATGAALGGRGCRLLLRVSAGRFDDERPGGLGDEELAHRLLAELGQLLAVRGRPRTTHVQRWEDAFPQYLPGHAARIRAVLSEVSSTGCLAVAGALLGGIGIPACIASGEAAAFALSDLAAGRVG